MPVLHQQPVELGQKASKSTLPVSPSVQPNNVIIPRPSSEHLQIQRTAMPLLTRPLELRRMPPRRILSVLPSNGSDNARKPQSSSSEDIQIQNTGMNLPPSLPRRILPVSPSNQSNNVTILWHSSEDLQTQTAGMHPPSQPSELAHKITNQNQKPDITFDVKYWNMMLWHEGEKVFETRLASPDQPIPVLVDADGCYSPTRSVKLESTRKSKRTTSNFKTSKGPQIILKNCPTRFDSPAIPASEAVPNEPAAAVSYNAPILLHSAFSGPSVNAHPPITKQTSEGRKMRHRHRHDSAHHKEFTRTTSNDLMVISDTNPSERRNMPQSHFDNAWSPDKVKSNRLKTRLLSTSRSFNEVPVSHLFRHTASNKNLATEYVIHRNSSEEDAFANFLHMSPRQGSFVYTNLENTETQIRLLRIRPKRQDLLSHIYLNQDGDDKISCDIIHASFKDHPPYLAISYTWGHPDDN
ncbi:hypothetical protein OCU04_003376 [Sclerotinia nivalis]|uniref:Heterokaryon incompatibility domain-containing protein n=1 Tax=Sclerotinia nivalis TaxID=352851 RepID=A0A9X0ARS4_9HELO|nr:hypothetical protein OCU04_003376 [Sclerotinia nivalis]